MATIRKELTLTAAPEAVWDAFRDYQNVHERVAKGFVVASKPEGEGARLITFANGMITREDLISMDDAGRRLAYTAAGGGVLKHHNGVFEVKPEGAGTKVVWTLDVLPHEAAPVISEMMEAGCAAMRRTLG